MSILNPSLQELALTDRMYIHLNRRRHDLVPPIYLDNEPSAALKRARTAKGMREGRGWRKILVDGLFLDGRDGLREELYYAGDFGHY